MQGILKLIHKIPRFKLVLIGLFLILFSTLLVLIEIYRLNCYENGVLCQKVLSNTSASNQNNASSSKQITYKTAEVSGHKLHLELADTPETREKGLSVRSALNGDTGMLFVFDLPAKLGFWMKDMQFPIDIIWLDKDKVVVTIATRVEPSTYPESFYPERNSKYVIELAAGKAADLGLNVGQRIDF